MEKQIYWMGKKKSFIDYHKPTSMDNPFFQINFSEEGHYRLSLNYKDPSGNPIEWDEDYGLSEEGLKVTVDKTDPKIFFDPLPKVDRYGTLRRMSNLQQRF